MSEVIKKPAYKEPWFWGVFSPLIIVALVCSVLVTFAVIGADDRVYDDYYKQGRMINNQFDAEKNALALAVQGQIFFNDEFSAVDLTLRGRADPDRLILQFSHPSEAQLDHQLVAERIQPGRYRSPLSGEMEGRWYLIVRAEESESEVPWRVSTEINLAQSLRAEFSAHR